MLQRWQLVLDLYATRADYEPVLQTVEAQRRLKYVQCGMFSSPHLPTYYLGVDIPHLGVAITGIAVQEDNYVVLDASIEPYIRKVELYKGGVRYTTSQGDNPTSISFQPGGIYEGCCLIKGDIATISRDAASLSLYRLFVRAFKKTFVAIDDYWLGPEAFELFQAGMRFTDDVRSSSMYDLKPKRLALPFIDKSG
jgi:hypothetical protein